MNFGRRRFVQLGMGAALSFHANRLLAQGVSTHTAKPLPRRKASGRPFNAHFVDVAAAAGLHAPVIYADPEIKKYTVESTGCGCAFIDYDNDGWTDLFVLCGTRLGGAPEGTTNRLYKGWHSLYRNNGDGTFTDVTQQAGIARAAATYGMTVVAADFDEDGWQDIYVACDSTPSLLFMNNRDGTFREEGVLRGAALSDDGMEQAGMGIGVGDYDLDGHLDLFKTHFVDDANILYHNDGKGNFEDATGSSRVGVETRYVCWGAGIVDLDNDGLPDIFMVTGHVYPQVERILSQYPYKTPRAVFRNLGKGVFEELIEEAGPGVAAAHCSRGCAFGDFDNDGDIDILIINLNEPPSLLRNDLVGKSNWIKVKLEGVKSNRSAIGARVLVHYGGKTQAQAVLSQSSFFSCSDSRLHFGLGDSTSADIDVYWPSGLHETFKQIPGNRLITIKEGVGPVPNRGWSKGK